MFILIPSAGTMTENPNSSQNWRHSHYPCNTGSSKNCAAIFLENGLVSWSWFSVICYTQPNVL